VNSKTPALWRPRKIGSVQPAAGASIPPRRLHTWWRRARGTSPQYLTGSKGRQQLATHITLLCSALDRRPPAGRHDARCRVVGSSGWALLPAPRALSVSASASASAPQPPPRPPPSAPRRAAPPRPHLPPPPRRRDAPARCGGRPPAALSRRLRGKSSTACLLSLSLSTFVCLAVIRSPSYVFFIFLLLVVLRVPPRRARTSISSEFPSGNYTLRVPVSRGSCGGERSKRGGPRFSIPGAVIPTWQC
jgi:hypothetical protein